jgi:PIN domain nuclease of toxin-antitoxin system
VSGTIDQFFMKGVAALRMRLLPLQLSHIAGLHELPPIHRDPFDRLLVATARAEDLTLVSRDRVLAGYDVSIVW